MSPEPTPEREPTPEPERSRRWLPAAVLAAVLLVGAAVAVVALPGGDDPVRTVTESPAGSAGDPGDGPPVVLGAPTQGAGRCLVPTPESVARMDVALEGRVVDLEGGAVTLEVAQWYAGGDDAATVELRNPRELLGLVGGVPSFEVGQRWLVSGSAGTVAVCGFTEPWSPAGAQLFEEAFAS